MGTIRPNHRKDGSTTYTAQVRRKKKGKTVFNKVETFDDLKEAKSWVKHVEKRLSSPGFAAEQIERQRDKTLAETIQVYIDTHPGHIGQTKLQCLRSLMRFDFSAQNVTTMTDKDFLDIARSLRAGDQPAPIDPLTAGENHYDRKPRTPATVSGYMSYLGVVIEHAGPLTGLVMPKAALLQARSSCRHFGLVGKSKARNRRPTLGELDQLMEYFEAFSAEDPRAVPMHMIVLAAIFLTYRQSEHTRVEWKDLEADLADEDPSLLIRDMKHPSSKPGNDVEVRLRKEGLAVIQAMPKTDKRIFPYHPDTISRRFTQACKVLGIEDLHFHDLRHEGVSRLFELGLDIPRVQRHTGHKNWTTLQRYAHIKHYGDKFSDWKWLKLIGL